MTGYIVRRLLWMVVVLWAIVTITFVLMHAVEGGPFSRERELPPSAIEALNRKYGLDKPVLSVDVWNSQYGNYIGNLLQGDLGASFRSGDQSVSHLIRQGFGVSLQLGVMAFIFAVVLGMTLGIISALNHNGVLDYVGVFFSTAGASMPNFVLAGILIPVFAVELGWFDVLGWGGPGFDVFGPASYSNNFDPSAWDLRKVVLPVVALGVLPAAYFARITRASMLEVLGQDYIRTARAKGLSEWTVILRHSIKNAMVPILTVMGPYLAFLVTGSFLVETVFSIPGVGRRFVEAVVVRDYGMIMGTVIFYTVFIAFANLIVDVLYAVVDPRIKYA
jgi:oligopeptide transport system permease protein